MLLAVEGGGMREYFGPESGRGLGARDFAWTAALYLREARSAQAAGSAGRQVALTLRAMAAPARPVTDAERWFRERYARTPERDALFTTI